jgi:hypothetical protein
MVEQHPQQRSTEALAPVLRINHQLGGSVGAQCGVPGKVGRAWFARVCEEVGVAWVLPVEVQQGVLGEWVDSVALSSRASELGDGCGGGRGQR